MKTFILTSSRKENNMSNYFKADLFKIYKEHRLFLSLGILLTLSILSAFLLRGNEGYTSSVIQLLSQFITFLCILLFVTLKRIPQAYLVYILICLLFDNIFHLISTNLFHLDLPSEFFLFQSLQNAESISVLTFILSTVSLILYCFLSYFIFSRKEFK